MIIATASSAYAQLTMNTWRAANGQVYQVLQHRASDDLGIGIDDVQVTTVVANTFAAETCTKPDNPLNTIAGLEAVTSGPIGGRLPLELAFKSSVIADATPPCFSSDAVDGLGSVCVGPGCNDACVCGDGADCVAFSIADGSNMAMATPDVPAAHDQLPFSDNKGSCRAGGANNFSFGSDRSVTTDAGICTRAPADGFRLPGTPSAYMRGTDGTTIIFAYSVQGHQEVFLSAAGFGIDTNSDNAFDCDAPGLIIAAVEANGEGAPSMPPPGPPVDLDAAERRCQQAIGRSGRRYLSKVLKALQLCREKILAGTWEIEANQCANQPSVMRAIAAATRVTRASIRAKCQNIDLEKLLTCGNSVDELIAADGSGCVADSHRTMAEQLATTQFGF